MTPTTLLAYPNVSEGKDRAAIDRIGRAFGDALLDVHSDVDHHRSAYTLAGAPGELAGAVINGAREAVATIQLDAHDGVHPRVGALDVAPIVYLHDPDRGAAVAEALVLADALGSELELPVFLYGALASGRTRAELRRGGPASSSAASTPASSRPTSARRSLHPTAGAVLVAARPPLVAFNVELAPPATLEDARRIAAHIRESGDEGLPGSARSDCGWPKRPRPGLDQRRGPSRHPAARRRRGRRPPRARPGAELVGLAPEAAFERFPQDIPLRGYATIEQTLHRHARSA